jgi:hypothetical protein
VTAPTIDITHVDAKATAASGLQAYPAHEDWTQNPAATDPVDPAHHPNNQSQQGRASDTQQAVALPDYPPGDPEPAPAPDLVVRVKPWRDSSATMFLRLIG